ncbi:MULTISPECIES: hypothetical protein [unclassified Mesorhizobium]|uniref:hypothetical protein n=1 Tax=unclassified Mesorhizobium TaxID=325217 RepID=UPI0013E08229|nr:MULTISPECIES: hypothetical protein [unclassified Mesorhizobium]
MDQKLPYAHDIFPHIRIVMGMVIGLGVTRHPAALRHVRLTTAGPFGRAKDAVKT